MGIHLTFWWSHWWSFLLHYHLKPPVTLQKDLKTASASGDTILKLTSSLGNEQADAHLQAPPPSVCEDETDQGHFPERRPMSDTCMLSENKLPS